MVEQTKESTCTKYGITYAESGLSNSDKQQHPVSEPADSRHEKSLTVSKSIGSPHLMEDNGRCHEVVEISEIKKPMSTLPKSNSGMGHKVYVRRRPETELAKSQSHPFETQIHSNKSTEQGETTQENGTPLEGASSPSFSSWEERYRCLQSLLKMLDRSGQEDYLKMLRSMSCVELSKHALELEKRSIRLSLEEGREVQRMRLYDVLGAKYEKNMNVASHDSSTPSPSPSPSNQQQHN